MPLTWSGDITLTTGPFGDLIILDSSYLKGILKLSIVISQNFCFPFYNNKFHVIIFFFTVLLTD